MAPARNARTTHPAVSQQVEQILEARGIDYEFVPNYRIADIRDVEGNQVRLIEHRAPKNQVARYATAMKHGANFPAILLNDEGERIDGNTRLEARMKNREESIPAYVCHGISALDARSLSVELNQSNGLAMTDEEIRGFIEGAVHDGEKPDVKSLARMTGVRENKILRWIAESQFGTRAAREGLDDRLVGLLPESTRAALHGVRLDPVFRALTSLAAEARIPANQVKRLVAQVNSAASQDEALGLVSAERDARGDELRAVASGFKPRGRLSNGSAQHLGGLVRFDVDDLLDVDRDKQYEMYTRMKTVQVRLATVVARAETEWDLTPPAQSSGNEPAHDMAVSSGVPEPAVA